LYAGFDGPIKNYFDVQHGRDVTSHADRRENPAGAAVSVLLWLDMDRLGVIVFFVALANTWSLVVPKEWLREHRLFDGEPLGVVGGITVWYVCTTFVTYWYHRFQHRFSFAWRMLHQVHHGVPRVDIPSALVAHPLDVIVSTTLSILVTAFLLGLDLRAVTIVSVLQFFITLFPHWNVRTPNWVGYLIQRPEEHILHHQREVHGGNFSDWPLWDKVFGTYRAPIEEPIRVGFDRAGFAEQLKMLAFVDVNAPAYVNGGRIESTFGASSVSS
jgi:sterol desaturase/sphingolipid hydroxylase (fatty acid hydroxylase superfamily)